LEKVARIQNITGRVADVVDGGQRFKLMDFQSGQTRTYDVSLVLENFGS
jgi:hypothetical protein